MYIKRLSLIIFLIVSFMIGGCEKVPELKTTSLTTHEFQDFNVYYFLFTFTNLSDQPITIKSLEVLDENNQQLDDSNMLSKEIEKIMPIELLTHDTYLQGFDQNPFDLKKSPLSHLAEGTPLERAALISHAEYVKGKRVAVEDPDRARKVTIQREQRIMKPKESIDPARYLFFSKKNYKVLQLRINYDDVKGPKNVQVQFTAKQA
ncbi:MAG: hypothetical protein HQM14_01400 [SAR324 cluster bacterium]|nr:hypothetical protein [SAR324 cluster bacterium]